MIKRLYNVARASLYSFILREKEGSAYDTEDREFVQNRSDTYDNNLDPLTSYYANLELQPGASRVQVKQAWRRLLKRYHPDLHSVDPEKRKIATELTGHLNEAYHIWDKELLKRG